MLRPCPIGPVPAQTARVARAAFPKGNLYLRVADELGTLFTDDLWHIIAPLLPPEPPKPKDGCPRVPDRAALTGILFILKTGCPWQALPKELGCGSGSTCWRRLPLPIRHELHLE